MVIAPELVGLLGSFALVCALMALSFGYAYTFGALLRALARLLDVGIDLQFTTVRPFGFLAGALTDVDNFIRHGLGVGIEYAQYGFNKMLQAISYSIQELGNAIEGLASDTRQALDGLRHITIPGVISLLLGPLAAKLYQLGLRVAALAEAAAGAAVHPGRIITHTIERVRTIEHTVIKTVTVTVPAVASTAIAWPRARIGQLEREASTAEKWIRAHAGDFTVAGIAGLIGATILSRFDLGWLRCKGVGRVGKALCGLSGLIETIAMDAIGALLITDLCAFAAALEYTAERTRPLMLEYVDVENALIGCRGYTAPAELELAGVSATPVLRPIAL